MAFRRLLVTPSAEVFAILDEIHRLTGQGRATVVREVLDNVMPILASHLDAVRYVHEGRFAEAQAAVAEMVATNVNKATQAQLDLAEAVKSAKTPKKPRKGRSQEGRPSSA